MFENISVEQANNELQLSLRTLDSNKLKQIKEYKVAFNKLVNDSKLKELLKKHGVDSKKVTDYVVNYYENRDKCLISETIYKYISNNINAEFYGELELNGKSKPMKVYQLI